jgi:putative acetyltransferase
MNIRPECPEDIAGVWAVERAAFGRDAEADLADRLRAHGKVRLSMLAEEDGVVLGHVLYSGVRLEGEHGVWHALGLGPLAVDPARQRQGIGAALVRASLERLREQGEPLVCVEGDPRYYTRFGFSDAAPAGITCEFNPPPGCFMLLELAVGSLGGRRGVVHYADEFQAVG